MKKFYLLLAVMMPLATVAQTLTDGFMMPRKDLCTGIIYSHDQWKKYWEGELKRDNQNIGTLTTQSLMWVGVYGITEKINVMAMLPYVETEASKGTLSGMKGLQDMTIGVKYNFLKADLDKFVFKTFAALSFSTPMSDYTADFLPMSIGMESTNGTLRLGTYLRHETGLLFNANAGYTVRSNVDIDRVAYYDGNELVMSNEVKMPNVFDFILSLGYVSGPVQSHVDYIQQNTLGGADIRRQDMPFVSNRMNYSKVNFDVQYFLPKPHGLAVKAAYAFTVAGRNVGQSTTVQGGLLYTIHFAKPE